MRSKAEFHNQLNHAWIGCCRSNRPEGGRSLQRAGVELVVAHRNSSQSLALLKQGSVHLAGSHIRDEAMGESNLPVVNKLFPGKSVCGVSVAVGESEIDPRDRGYDPSGHCDREPRGWSGQPLVARCQKVRGYDKIANGHVPAAWQVRIGQADCCVATRAAARVLGLDFIPLVSERYDLVIHRRHLSLPGVQALFDTLNRAAFRRELEGLGGYDNAMG